MKLMDPQLVKRIVEAALLAAMKATGASTRGIRVVLRKLSSLAGSGFSNGLAKVVLGVMPPRSSTQVGAIASVRWVP